MMRWPRFSVVMSYHVGPMISENDGPMISKYDDSQREAIYILLLQYKYIYMYYFISMYIYISNESQRISQPELFWESRPETPWSPVFH